MSTVIDGLAVVVAIVAFWYAVRYLGRFLAWVEKSEIARQQAEAAAQRKKVAPAAAPVRQTEPEPAGIPVEHVVAIAAAVAAYGARVVHIVDPATGNAWASEGRWQHQTSHRTH